MRPLLFRCEPEASHRLVFSLLRPLEKALELQRNPTPFACDSILRQDLFGIPFASPVGLAAGFDKNCELPDVWRALGFGFAELGTVTARPQPGNERPRLFRLPADRALINRLGFNNDGAEAVAAKLSRRLGQRALGIPIGLNIGKSRSAQLSDASADYASSLRQLWHLADYLAINVSSPNTPGLRDLQSESQLEPLLNAIQDENERCAAARGTAVRPVLLKVSPDLDEPALETIVAVAARCKIAGLIATNTTIQRPPLNAPPQVASQAGGLSGAPLRDLSTNVIRILYRQSGGRLPIIGVGGILDSDDAYAKIRAGASLVQVYTGFIYVGPALPLSLSEGLARCLRRDGFSTIGAAVGIDAGRAA